MKLKNILVPLLMVIALLCCLPAQAAERQLTVKRAIQINDKEIVIEFSEPIALNYHQTNRGPHMALRVTNAAGNIQRYKEEILHPSYDAVLQWNGTIQFVDEKHDRLIWTLTDGTFGCSSVTQILNWEGLHGVYKDKYFVTFGIEEVPYDTTVPTADGKLCNITTADGEVYLTPLYLSGWEACNLPVEVNFGYKVDRSQFNPSESINEIKGITKNPISEGNGPIEEIMDDPMDEIQVTQVVQNNPFVIAIILGAGVAVAVLLVLVITLIKKRKAA